MSIIISWMNELTFQQFFLRTEWFIITLVGTWFDRTYLTCQRHFEMPAKSWGSSWWDRTVRRRRGDPASPTPTTWWDSPSAPCSSDRVSEENRSHWPNPWSPPSKSLSKTISISSIGWTTKPGRPRETKPTLLPTWLVHFIFIWIHFHNNNRHLK